MPRHRSNGKERSFGASLFLRLAQSASVDGVVEDFTKIATEKGIKLCSVRLTCDRLEREFNLPNVSAVAGRVQELAVCVDGGQTHFVVTFCEPMDSSVICELEYAAHLAAFRIEFLAGRGLHSDRTVAGSADRLLLIEGLIGESELMREVRENIMIAAPLDLSVLIVGEPGTGKELVARGIHKASRRAVSFLQAGLFPTQVDVPVHVPEMALCFDCHRIGFDAGRAVAARHTPRNDTRMTMAYVV